MTCFWLSNSPWLSHASLCDTILYLQGCSVERLLILICLLETALARGYSGWAYWSAARSDTGWLFFLWVMLCSALQTRPLGYGRDVSWLNLYFVPSHTWPPCVVSPCYQCGISYQSILINASNSCRVTFSVTGCWESKPSGLPTLIQLFVLFIFSVQNITPLIMTLHS